jgi:hypothetical protein
VAEGRDGGHAEEATEKPSHGGWLRWALPALIAVIYSVVFLLKAPDPTDLVWNPDWGYQLAGANQIRHGLWPFLDFRAVYGPLAFATSAAAQWLTGGRIIGEIALSYLGYLASTLLVYGLTAKASGSRAIAFFVTLFALLVLPKLYKYYIVLTPLWVLWESWRYLERPSLGRLFLLTLAVVVTGLFRPDTGLYAAVAGLACVWLAHRESGKGFFREAALFFALLLLCASPWLAVLIVRHRLHDYFYESIHDGAGLAKGLSLPWPRINFQHNTFATETFAATIYNFFFTLVPFCAVALYQSRKTVPAGQQKGLIATMILAQLCLLEAVHRPDYHHLNQALAPCLPLVGWVVSQLPTWFKGSRGWRIAALASCAALGFLLVASVVIEHRIGYGEHRKQSLAKTLQLYTDTPDQILQYVLGRDPHNPYAQVAADLSYLSRYEHVFVMPYYDSIYYFSGRTFGRYMQIVPGLYTSPADQRDIIADLKQEDIKVVVVDPTYQIDGKEDRRVDHFANIVLPYVMTHYREVAHYGRFSVRLAPGKLPEPAGGLNASAE